MEQYARRYLKCEGRKAMRFKVPHDTRRIERERTRGSAVDERRMGVVRGLSLDHDVEALPQEPTGGQA